MKILIIRFSSIGDIVLTSPVVRCLKCQLPGSEIHYLSKESYKSLLQNNPYIDKVHLMFESDLKMVVENLKKENFDYVIDLHKNLRSFYVKRKLSVKHSSFHKANIAKWIMVNLKIDVLPKKHIVDRYMETVSSLGVKNDGAGLDFYVPPEDSVNISESIPQLNLPYIALVIGAKFTTKQYPLTKLTELCQLIDDDIVLIGGKEDFELGEELRKVRNGIYNMSGALSLNQSADIIRQSGLVISNDTGMMHIAAALRKPIISIWGNTIPGFGMYPYYPERSDGKFEIIENSDISCRPCSKIGYDQCPKKHFKCMMDLDVEKIQRSINKIRKAT